MNDLIRPSASITLTTRLSRSSSPQSQGLPRRRSTSSARSASRETSLPETRELPTVKPGELVLLLDAGAYGMSLTSNYNTRPRPAEVLVDGANVYPIRRRETMRDLLAPNCCPPPNQPQHAKLTRSPGPADHGGLRQNHHRGSACPAIQNGRQSSIRRARSTPSAARSSPA